MTKTIATDLPVPSAFFSSRRLLECNTLFSEVFLPTESQGSGSFALTAFAGEQNAALAKEFARLVNSAEPLRSPVVREATLPTREGERRFLLSALPSTYDGKRALRIVAQDVTQYAERARNAEIAESRYRVYVESSTAAIAMARNGAFVYVNKGFLDLLGYMFVEELVGKEVTQCFAARDRKGVNELGSPIGEPGESSAVVERTALRKDSSRVRLQIRTETVTVDGQPTMLWHCLDVSSWRDVQEGNELKSRENEILEHLLLAVHQTVDRGELQKGVLAASLRWLGYDSGGLFVLADDGNSFVLETTDKLSPVLLEKLHELPAAEGLIGYVAKTMEPVRVSIEEYPAHLPFRALFESEAIRTLAFLPLGHEEKPAGVLMLLSTKAHEVPPYHEAFLGVVARHLGFALHKSSVYSAIQQRSDSYQDAVEHLPGTVYVAASNGTIRYLSPVIERMTGYKVRELTASPDAWRAVVHPDDRPIATERISRQAGAENEFFLEYRVLPKGKASYIWLRDGVRYYRAADGTVQGIYGFLIDITAQKAVIPPANVSVEPTSSNVPEIAEESADRSNEANGFVRVVAHDLKEPLIAIESYAKLVVEDAGSNLDEESRDHLDAIVRSSGRMKQLMDDLLALARLGHKQQRHDPVPASTVLDEVALDLELFLRGRKAHLEFPSDLPSVPCDPAELSIVFRNLIVNGVLHNSRENPIVRIAATTDDRQVIFSVMDNGGGLDAKDDPRPGTGLGIVRKVVESFEGSLSWSSTPDAGSTFSFTVPNNE